MRKDAAGVATCLAIAAAATALAPGAGAAHAMGLLAPMAGGALVGVSGIAINFGHELCKRFLARASAYREKVWGLDKNEHVGRGVRRAQIAATREVLRLWRRQLPRYDGNND